MHDTASESRIELEIFTEKDSYIIDEPIYLIARLTNLSTEPLPVPPPVVEPSGLPSNIGLMVKSDSGDTIQPVSREKSGGIEIGAIVGERNQLLPGRSWVVVVDLLASFGRGQDHGNMVFRRGRFGKGRYVVEAFYRASFAQAGIVKSRAATFVVRDVPLSEMLARRRMLKAHRLYRSEQSERDQQQAVRLYERMIRKNRRSRYLPDAYRMLAEISRSEPPDRIRDRAFDAHAKFNDPVFLYNFAMHLEETPHMNRQQLRELLHRLFWRSPGTTFSEVVRQRLLFELMIDQACEEELVRNQPAATDTKQTREKPAIAGEEEA